MVFACDAIFDDFDFSDEYMVTYELIVSTFKIRMLKLLFKAIIFNVRTQGRSSTSLT